MKKKRIAHCRYCDRDFELKSINGAGNRFSCYRPKCEAEHKEYMRLRGLEATKAWRVQHGKRKRTAKGARMCSFCGEPLPKNRLFYHTYCYKRANNEEQIGLVDGNWVYA